MVGTVRFELTASCSQSRRANQTTLRPVKNANCKVFAQKKQSNSANLKLLLFRDAFGLQKTHQDIMIC